MPQILAIDWDQRETRYVLANVGRRDVRVQEMGDIPLPPAADDPQHVDRAFAEQIAEVLARHNARRARLLVTLPRSSVELLYLTLPPAKDEELPELVANQALQEMPMLTHIVAIAYALPFSGMPLPSR